MFKSRPSSFRKILVSRILLIFIPVLLVGEVLALNKARSNLLENARANLTTTARIRGNEIIRGIKSLKTNVKFASKMSPIKTGTPTEIEEFFIQLTRQLSVPIQCIQLTDISSGNLMTSTCSDKPIFPLQLPLSDEDLQVKTVLNPQPGVTGISNQTSQLHILLSVPIYNSTGKLIYALSIQAIIYQESHKNTDPPRNNTIIIAEDGTILAHPQLEKVGVNVATVANGKSLKKIIQNAILEDNKSVNLRLLSGIELVAGYATIPGLTNIKPQEQWIIIVATSLDNALSGLEELQLILIVLTVGLIAASLLTSLYLAPYLARPVERLRDYALNLNSYQDMEPIPHDLEIREFNQLAQALNQMVERLRVWAEELEIAWQEAKTANHVKSQFLAATSHELRNPLNIIINCIRLVTDGLCDSREEEMDFLQRADETAIHLLGIINDILDISKIEAGKLSVFLEPVDLRELLLDVINLQSVNIQQKCLKLQCDLIEQEIPVNADPAKLKQVIINIISNAAKFTENGSIDIYAEIKPSNTGKSLAVVTIKDTGIGIDPRQQGKLFRPFVMVDDNSTRKFSGTGLGLAISRNLLELMGGRITLNSDGINQGTTVIISLPLISKSLLSPPSNLDDFGDDDSNHQQKSHQPIQLGNNQHMEVLSNSSSKDSLGDILGSTPSCLPEIKTPI